MPRIYLINHDRETTDLSDYLAELLRARYGPNNVVRGTTAAPMAYQEAVERDLRSCDVALVVIGRHWVELLDDSRRLTLATALRVGMLVAPVLDNSATMPSTAQLPDELAALPSIQAFPIRPAPDFHDDIDRLYRQINTKLTWRPAHAPLTAFAALGITFWVGYVLVAVVGVPTIGLLGLGLLVALLGPALLLAASIAALFIAIRRHSKWWPWIIVGADVVSVIAFLLPGEASLLDFPAFALLLTALMLFALIGPRRETAFH